MASDRTDPMPTNHTIYGSRENAGIMRTGFLFGNPISSYDINSMQNALAGTLAGIMPAQAEAEIARPGGSYLMDGTATLKGIRFSVRDEARGSDYIAFCPLLEVNAPAQYTRDQYLRIYCRFTAYAQHTQTDWIQDGDYMVVSDRMYRYGYRKSDSTVTPETEIQNDIAGNCMDSETSVRFGIEWTLSWEYDTKLPGFTEGQPIALYRYIDQSTRVLFGIGKDCDPGNPPNLYAMPAGDSYLILDSIYNSPSYSEDSEYPAVIALGASFGMDSPRRVIVGRKDNPLLDLEYRLADGSIVSDSSLYPDIRWEAGKQYLMACSSYGLSYRDPSHSHMRYIRYREIIHQAHGTSFTGRILKMPVLFDYSPKDSRFYPRANAVVNIGGKSLKQGDSLPSRYTGLDHYYNGKRWLTCIPPGVTVHTPRHHGIASMAPCAPVGAVCCNGQSLSKEDYPGLWQFLGSTFEDPNNPGMFRVPNYNGRFIRSTISTLTYENYLRNGDSSFIVRQSNIQAVSKTISPSVTIGDTTAGVSVNSYSKTLTSTGTIESSKLNTLASRIRNHYHINGVSAVGNPSISGSQYLPDTAVVYNPNFRIRATAEHEYPYGSIMPNSPIDNPPKITQHGYSGGYAYVMPGYDNDAGTESFWGITSESYDSGSSSISPINISVTGTLPTITVSGQKHTHTATATSATVKFGSDNPEKIDATPPYANVATYIYLGQSLVIEEEEGTETEVTVYSESDPVYISPSASSEIYASESAGA